MNARNCAPSISQNSSAIPHQDSDNNDDWIEDCRQPPMKSFRSFASIRRQLGHRKKVLQQEKEQRELMEQPQNDSSNEVDEHELGKPFLSTFTRSHLRSIRKKWTVEESETIVFGNDENATPDDNLEPNTKENAQQEMVVSNSMNSKRWKKKKEKKKWISRVKNRALAFSAKPRVNREGTSKVNNKQKNRIDAENKLKIKPASELKTPGIESSPTPQLEHYSSPLSTPKSPQSSEEEHEISSADPVAVGLDEELLRESTNDFLPSLVYPKGILLVESKDKAHSQAAYTPYCYSSDDDSSRRETLHDKLLHPSGEKAVVRVVGRATASDQGEFSEDSSIGSIPSVRMDEVSSRFSRDSSGFAGLLSQQSSKSEEEKEQAKIRIGRTIVGILDSDAQSASSIESSMESIPNLLLKESTAVPRDILRIDVANDDNEDSMESILSLFKDSTVPRDALRIDGEDDNKVTSFAQLASGKISTARSLDPKVGEESAEDVHRLSVSFDSIPSPTSFKRQRQAYYFQPEYITNESPPPSPIQPTILEAPSFDGAFRDHADDIPVQENEKSSLFRKLLSCGSSIKITKGKALGAKASNFKLRMKKKIKGNKSVETNENASASPRSLSFITTASSPSGTTFISSPGSSSARSVVSGFSPCRKDENISSKTPSPRKRLPKNKDPFTTPESTRTKKPFDYRRPTPVVPKATRQKQSAGRSAPVSLILDSFAKLTKKKNPPSSRRTRQVRNLLSQVLGKKLPMLIAIGLAALCQSILANLDASNSLTILCGSSNPLVYGFAFDTISMASIAQSMIAQG